MTAFPKNPPKRDEKYRRWISSQPCIHCGSAAPTQAAHADESKGMGMKSSDETVIPLCATSYGRRGCHEIFGASGMFTREQRRTLERNYAERMQAIAKAAGAWPKAWQ